MRWLEQVLQPLEDLPTDHEQRLKAALAMTLGIDPIIIMKDVCHLDDDALAVLRWAATALLRAGIEAAAR